MKKAVFFVFILVLLTTSVYAFSIKNELTGFSINDFLNNLFGINKGFVGVDINNYEGEPDIIISP